MIKNWLLPQLQTDGHDFILQEGASPNWTPEIIAHILSTINYHSDRSVILFLAATSSDLPICDFFFLWGYIKKTVLVPPLPKNLDELENRITDAINLIIINMLQQVYEKFECHLNVCRACKGVTLNNRKYCN